MKRFWTMLAVSLAVSMVVVACASMQTGGRDLVTKAVSAQGSADALAAVKTISYKDGKPHFQSELKEVKKESLAANLFEVPSGLTMKKMGKPE